MAALKDDVKTFIVQALACYDTPSQVVHAVKQEFGIEVPRAQVALYDPTKTAGRSLGAKLRDLFTATRKAFLDEAATIPIAQQAYRLRVLQRLQQQAESRGNAALAAQLLEQAAKEVGGAFTNRREVTGKGGGPIQQANLTPAQFAETARRIAAEV